MTIREKIEEILHERGLKKTEFADMLGVKKQNVNKMLETKNYVTVRKMAKVLGVEMSLFFTTDPNLIEKEDAEELEEKSIPPSVSGFLEIDNEIHKVNSYGELKELVESIDDELD